MGKKGEGKVGRGSRGRKKEMEKGKEGKLAVYVPQSEILDPALFAVH